jgi:hypothetical protein
VLHPLEQEREVALDLTLYFPAGAAEQRAQSSVESELLTMVRDDVEYGTKGFATRVVGRGRVAAGTASDSRSDAATPTNNRRPRLPAQM